MNRFIQIILLYQSYGIEPYRIIATKTKSFRRPLHEDTNFDIIRFYLWSNPPKRNLSFDLTNHKRWDSKNNHIFQWKLFLFCWGRPTEKKVSSIARLSSRSAAYLTFQQPFRPQLHLIPYKQGIILIVDFYEHSFHSL